MHGKGVMINNYRYSFKEMVDRLIKYEVISRDHLCRTTTNPKIIVMLENAAPDSVLTEE